MPAATREQAGAVSESWAGAEGFGERPVSLLAHPSGATASEAGPAGRRGLPMFAALRAPPGFPRGSAADAAGGGAAAAAAPRAGGGGWPLAGGQGAGARPPEHGADTAPNEPAGGSQLLRDGPARFPASNPEPAGSGGNDRMAAQTAAAVAAVRPSLFCCLFPPAVCFIWLITAPIFSGHRGDCRGGHFWRP